MRQTSKHSIQTPLGRAKGLGSAHEGAHHQIMHDVTTLTNIPLVLWVMYSAFTLRGASYEEVMVWVAHPVSMILGVLFVISVFKHFAMELQVVFEDYISCKCARMIAVIGTKLLFFVLGLTTIISILKVGFTPGL